MHHNVHKHDEVVRTLHLLQNAGFKSAIIGGGAIRDLYFEIMPRDIDIFLWDPNYSDENIDEETKKIVHPTTTHPKVGTNVIWNIMKLRSTYSFHHVDDDVRRIYSNYGDSRVTVIWDVMKNLLPFQLVFLKDRPVDYVEDHFDFGLCKCYCDGEKFRFTPDFNRDVKNKTITLVAKDLTEEEYRYAMEQHLPKVKDKYPGFRVQVAPWNEPLVAKYGLP